jgi:hypothetical protein
LRTAFPKSECFREVEMTRTSRNGDVILVVDELGAGGAAARRSWHLRRVQVVPVTVLPDLVIR